MIAAGKLRQRIQVWHLPATPNTANEFNEPTTEPAIYASVWASVEPLEGRELWQAREVAADVTHKVTIRYRTGIVSRMWLVCKGRTLQIESVVNPNEINESLVLMCKEKT